MGYNNSRDNLVEEKKEDGHHNNNCGGGSDSGRSHDSNGEKNKRPGSLSASSSLSNNDPEDNNANNDDAVASINEPSDMQQDNDLDLEEDHQQQRDQAHHHHHHQAHHHQQQQQHPQMPILNYPSNEAEAAALMQAKLAAAQHLLLEQAVVTAAQQQQNQQTQLMTSSLNSLQLNTAIHNTVGSFGVPVAMNVVGGHGIPQVMASGGGGGVVPPALLAAQQQQQAVAAQTAAALTLGRRSQTTMSPQSGLVGGLMPPSSSTEAALFANTTGGVVVPSITPNAMIAPFATAAGAVGGAGGGVPNHQIHPQVVGSMGATATALVGLNSIAAAPLLAAAAGGGGMRLNNTITNTASANHNPAMTAIVPSNNNANTPTTATISPHHHHHPHHLHHHHLSPQMTIPHYVPPIPPTWGAQTPALSVQDRPLVPPIYNGINPNYPGAQLLHAHPPIFAVDNFLSPAECDFLIDAASDAFGPAPVVGKGSGEVSRSRTSSTCYLAREDLPEYLRKVNLLTGKPPEHCELPQVGRYMPSQQYLQHFDAFDLANEDGRRFAANGGQRTVTVLVYLNDVPRGGATAFPNLNIEVQPRRGMALVFFPSTLDGLLDKMALHAAMPAVDVKYVSQVWIRQSNYDGRPSKRLAEPMVGGLQERREASLTSGGLAGLVRNDVLMGQLQQQAQQQHAQARLVQQQQQHHQVVQQQQQMQQLQQQQGYQQMSG